jgi:hypothetical protein
MGQGGFGRIAAVGLLLAAALGGASCGTSNDQGISFRALAFVVPDENGEIDLENPLVDQGRVVGLACNFPADNFAVLENLLIQGIQVQRLDLGYRIPGGSLNLPATGSPVSLRLGPSSGQDGGTPVLGAPRGFARAALLTPQQIEFLNQNRNRLPELPFRMIVTARAVGVADSGDVFITNEITYPIDVIDDEICGQPGEQPVPGPDPGSDPEATVPPFQTPAPNPQPTPIQ